MDLVRRSAWGAAEPTGRQVAIPAPVRYLFLHHSVTPDGGPSVIRGIQTFHQKSRGWNDIGYTWLYSPKDRVFYEGRGPGVSGAHTAGYNKTGHAVCVLGNYDTEQLPSTAIRDLAAWAEWHKTAGWGPSTYTPHQQMGQTACPGRNIMAVLSTINDLADGHSPQPLGEPTISQAEAAAHRDGDRSWGDWYDEIAGRFYKGPR